MRIESSCLDISFALKIGGEDTFNTWSDASFVDSTIDRRSSQGYAMKLFGGLINGLGHKSEWWISSNCLTRE
ncbi:hypothetical protein V8F33_013788 [Rhypophila sp. PSN 637]